MMQKGPRDFPRALRALERTLEGATFPEIAEELKVCPGRIRQLAMGAAAALLAPSRLGEDLAPEHNYRSQYERREFADFYRAQIAKARAAA